MQAGKVDQNDPCKMFVRDMYKVPKAFLLCRSGVMLQKSRAISQEDLGCADGIAVSLSGLSLPSLAGRCGGRGDTGGYDRLLLSTALARVSVLAALHIGSQQMITLNRSRWLVKEQDGYGKPNCLVFLEKRPKVTIVGWAL